MKPFRGRQGKGTGGVGRGLAGCLLAMCILLGGSSAHGQDGEGTAVDGRTAESFAGFVETTDTGGLETRSAALILSGQEGGDLPVALVTLPYRNDEETTDVGATGLDVWAGMSGSHLATAWPEDGDLLVEVYVYALDGRDGVAAYLSQAFRLQQEVHRPALAASLDLHFAGRLPLPPGDYSLRLLVLLRQSGLLGMRVRPASVPPTEVSGAAELPAPPPLEALFLAPVRGFLALADGDGAARPELFSGDGGPWAPREWPDLNGLQALHIDVPHGGDGFRGSAPDSEPESAATVPAVAVRVHDQNGRELSRATITPLRERSLAAPSRNLHRLDLQPFDLPAGQYLLSLQPDEEPSARAESRNAAAGRSSSPRLVPVRLGSDSPTTGLRTAATVNADGRGGEAARNATRPPARSPRPGNRRQLLAAYQGALELLASGQRREALDAVMAMEQQAMGDGSSERQTELMTLQLTFANDLAAQTAELLIPFMVLHDELYRTYRRRGELFLSTHSRKVVARLTELYSERAPAASAGQIRAEIFTSQAGFLLELGSVLSAQNALKVALENQAQFPAALYLQATVAEYVGDYEGAVNGLRRLAKVESLDGVGRLRLAVNLRRLGKKEDEAHALLLQLVDRPEDDWVTVVAFQEFAALLWEMGLQGDAQDILRRGVERFPEVPRLTIQWASMLDQLGRPGQARELLKAIDQGAPRGQATPRYLYSQWPLERVRDVRRSLRRSQRQHLPALRSAIDAGQGPRRAP